MPVPLTPSPVRIKRAAKKKTSLPAMKKPSLTGIKKPFFGTVQKRASYGAIKTPSLLREDLMALVDLLTSSEEEVSILALCLARTH